MKLLDDYLDLQKQLFDYFSYVEAWRVIPVDDARKYYWRLDGETYGGSVKFADTPELLDDEDMNYYENSIYTQCHLPKWVYRGDKYTMICVDTHTDSNQFLQIFDNSKELHN